MEMSKWSKTSFQKNCLNMILSSRFSLAQRWGNFLQEKGFSGGFAIDKKMIRMWQDASKSNTRSNYFSHIQITFSASKLHYFFLERVLQKSNAGICNVMWNSNYFFAHSNYFFPQSNYITFSFLTTTALQSHYFWTPPWKILYNQLFRLWGLKNKFSE